MSLAALIGGVLAFIGQLWLEYLKGAPARKAKADALAKIEAEESDAALARVLAEYERERLRNTQQ